VYTYVSNVTNATYMFNTNATDGYSAQAFCNANGAHLVSYGSLEEQQEVRTSCSPVHEPRRRLAAALGT
jgi:hypothetical protein